MAGSAQKQMVHISVPVWKDTRESTAKVNFLPASSSISTTASRMHVVTMVTVLDKQRPQERSIKLKLWPMFYSGRQKQDIACKQLKTILPSPPPPLRFKVLASNTRKGEVAFDLSHTERIQKIITNIITE